MKDYRQILKDRKTIYLETLRNIDPEGTGIFVDCPACGGESWILFPEENYSFQEELRICCPAACGHYSLLTDFSPSSLNRQTVFDGEHFCSRDKTRFKTFGAIHRCPVCAIENPREVMNSCANRVLSSTSTCREDLAAQLGSLVSTFDGVMRQCNRIAQQNAAHLNHTHPNVKSFQDAASAQKTLTPLFDMSKRVKDWPIFLETLHKRHALSHNLGVIDKKYVDKTGVSPSQIGRRIQLSRSQVEQFARDCKSIVGSYFGHFLS